MSGRKPLGRRRLAALVVLASVLFPRAAAGWGLAAHRWVATRAAELVHPACGELVRGPARAELAERAVEPDTILRGRLGRREEVRHFLDLDEYGRPPFRALPRDHRDAVAKFGRDRVRERGVLPWHVGTLARRLRDEIRRGDWAAARRSAGYLSHYAADATMPLHATKNHDGQLSGQRGVHRRIEARLVDARLAQYGARAAAVRPRRPIAPEASEAALFRTLLDSYDAVAIVLAADRAARRGTRVGSSLYYRRLDADLGGLLGERLGAATTLTAALWAGACSGDGAATPAARATRAPHATTTPRPSRTAPTR